jgi:hypothetical protein
MQTDQLKSTFLAEAIRINLLALLMQVGEHFLTQLIYVCFRLRFVHFRIVNVLSIRYRRHVLPVSVVLSRFLSV